MEKGIVEDVFKDFKGRRAGIVKALTTEFEEFYHQCNPERENLCLFGLPNGTWELKLPDEHVPPDLPEPALGINFARGPVQENHWLYLVSVHSDVWLLAVAFYYADTFGFSKADRKQLFNMINELPTLSEVLKGAAMKQQKEKGSISNRSTNIPKSNSKLRPSKALSKRLEPVEEEEEEHEEHGDALCGACGKNYALDDFWIWCDSCEKWFHGICVKITPAMAALINRYKCPLCSYKRAPRP